MRSFTRYITTLFVAIALPVAAFARSYIRPEPHKRFAPNAEYFLDFNPESDRHHVYATQRSDAPLWVIAADSFWPYAQDESDGCLFVANDGSSVAGLTWVHATGMPADHRVFDGLEFFNATGRIAAYRIAELPAGRIPLVDLPIQMAWFAIYGDLRGGQMSRRADMLRLTPFGMRSFDFEMSSGRITGWSINFRYFGYMALVYAIPFWVISNGLRRAVVFRRASQTPGAEANNSLSFLLTPSAVLVIANSALFAVGVYMDSFGGAIDRLGASICSLTYPVAFTLIPLTICLSLCGLFATPRKIDLLGPWLSVMSALAVLTLLRY